jgi:hypothetical protein
LKYFWPDPRFQNSSSHPNSQEKPIILLLQKEYLSEDYRNATELTGSWTLFERRSILMKFPISPQSRSSSTRLSGEKHMND